MKVQFAENQPQEISESEYKEITGFLTKKRKAVMLALARHEELSHRQLASEAGTTPTSLSNILIKFEQFPYKLLDCRSKGKFRIYNLTKLGRLYVDSLNESVTNNDSAKIYQSQEVNNRGTEIENCGMRLSEPQRYLVLSDQEKEEIFYIKNDDIEAGENVIKDVVDTHMAALPDINLYDNVADSGLLVQGIVALFSRMEKVFLNNYDTAKEYSHSKDYEGWLLFAPASSDLDMIIDGRALCWKYDVFNYEMAFMQANSFQTYAMEYAEQGGEVDTVIYYYGKSIQWTEVGLSYSDIDAETESDYRAYLRGRYKDVCDYIERNIPYIGEKWQEDYQELMKKAEMIYHNL